MGKARLRLSFERRECLGAAEPGRRNTVRARVGVGVGWGLGRAQQVRDSRAGEGWADETQHPASVARQTIFALGSDVSPDNRLSQSPRAPKSRTSTFQGPGHKEEIE